MSLFHVPLPHHVPLPQPDHIQKFKNLYHQYFGEHLNDEQALQQFISLLAVVKYQQDNATHEATSEQHNECRNSIRTNHSGSIDSK